MSNVVKKRAIFSGVLSNALEWYDYALYASFAPIFSSLFFSSEGSLYSTVKTFAIFAMGYVARPFGALIFGFIGDVKGRRFALFSSAALMILSTFLMGCTPSYDTFGNWSVWMLICVRILQGIAIGGGFSVSAIYLVEHAPPGKRALFGSFAMASLALGIVMGSVAFLITYRVFGFEVMFRWAWRLPFLMSGLFGLVLFYIKRNIYETKSFESHENKKSFRQLLQGVWHSRRNIALGFGLAAGDSVPFYTFAIALRTILEVSFGYSATESTIIGVIIVQCYAFSALLSGFLSDKTQERKVLTLACVAMAFICFPAMLFLKNNAASPMKYLMALLIGFSLGLYHGSLPSFFVKMFPAKTRSLSIALSYNTGVTIFGSTAPILFSFLVMREKGLFCLGCYVCAVIAVALFSVRMIRDSHEV